MKYKIEPWAHQLKAIERAVTEQDFALFFEMGTGKTGTLINILRAKFNFARRVYRTLILCPPIVINNWKDEWQKHSTIDPAEVVLLKGSGAQRLKLFQNRAWVDGAGQTLPVPKIFVTNYEALLMKPLFDAFMKWAPEVLVLDESHRCKDAKAKRTKLAIQLSERANHRYLLSGSPVLNSPLDLFSQFLVLDQGRTFGKNFFAFRGRYFRDRNAGMPRDRYFPEWEIMPGALEEINQLIFQKSMRVEKSECLDLPPLVRQTLLVDMAPDQARAYQEMKRDFLTVMQDQTILATMAMTKALRLLQIASGYAMSTTGETVSVEETPKLSALRELLEELTPNHKVLVWAVWKENYEQIRRVCRELGLGFVEVHGEVSSAQKFGNVDLFNNDPSIRVLIGHPGSGGIGINLVQASYSIFFSRTFSLEHSLQAEARNYRGGSEIHDKVTRIDLVCQGTIEELVTERLANKLEISDKVLRDLSLELAKQE